MQKHLLALAAGVATLALTTGAFAQSAGDGSNGSWTKQEGSNNELTITQSGNGNRAGLNADQRIYQGNSTSETGNALVINQSGSGNVVGQAYFYGTTVDANQTGQNNSLRIDQSNTNNSVAYHQFGHYNGMRDANTAPDSGRQFNAGDNYGAASGVANPKWNFIQQSGTGGNVVLSQDSTGSPSSNGVIALQGGTGTNHYIRLDQTTTSATAGSSDNLAYFDQRTEGSNVIADIKQTNTGAAYNLADIRQSGSNSTVTGSQNGFGLDLFVNQSGGNNSVSSTQDGSNSKVRVIQVNMPEGSLNQVISAQTGASNSLDVMQNGSGLLVNSMQTDGHQTATIDQTGFNNTYMGIQGGGTYNVASVYQGATGNNAYVTQNGSNNVATVRQNR